MAFKVFISHSTADPRLVYELSKWLKLNGIQAYVAEWYLQPGGSFPEKIAKIIDESDCILALMTIDGVKSQFVHQEIGYAKKANKQVIAVVEQEVTVGGFFEGIEYIPFRRNDPYEAITRAVEYLSALSARKEEEERNKAILAGLMIFFGLLALAASKKE